MHPSAVTASPAPVPLTIVTGDAALPAVVGGIEALAGRLVVAPASVLSALPGPNRGGRVTIAADIAPRAPGCPCCEVRLDVVDALARVARRRRPPAGLVLAVPGTEDVVTVVRTVLSDPELARLVALDGVVAAVDAPAAATRLAIGAPIGDQALVHRVAIADRIVPVGARGLTRTARADVVLALDRIAAFAPRPEPFEGAAARRLLDLRAWHGVPELHSGMARTTATAEVPGGDVELPSVVVLHQQGMLDPDAIDAWLGDIVAGHARRLLRLQGVLAVAGAPGRVCCHAVRSHASSHPEPPSVTNPRDRTTIVVCGMGLDAHELLTGLHAALRR